MTFLQAITQAFVKKPLHLTGRASRAEFWYVFLLLFLIDANSHIHSDRRHSLY